MAGRRRKAKERGASPELFQIFPEAPQLDLTDEDREKLRLVLEEIARLGAKEPEQS